MVMFVGTEDRWSVIGDRGCKAVEGSNSYLKGRWSVKALANSDKRMVPLPDSRDEKVLVTFNSGRITAFDGCDDISGGYRFKPRARDLQIVTLGTSKRAACSGQGSSLARQLRAVRHVQGQRDVRRMYDANWRIVIELSQ